MQIVYVSVLFLNLVFLSWNSWCGPCKLLEPRLETIIGSKNEDVHLAKVDIDDNAELAMKYDVSF